jgi:hypothetical protein
MGVRGHRAGQSAGAARVPRRFPWPAPSARQARGPTPGRHRRAAEIKESVRRCASADRDENESFRREIGVMPDTVMAEIERRVRIILAL